MTSVELFHWNPSLRRSPLLPGRIRKRVNNFGDLLGPMLVDRLRADRGLTGARADARLLSVGSVLHFAQAGDVVWGSGVNGKKRDVDLSALHLDIRAVRGPRTRDVLMAQGFEVPEVYGDPALLFGRLWPRASFLRRASRWPDVALVPNLHDLPGYRGDPRLVHPQGPVKNVVTRIANASFVAASSLHGIVIAESFGVPARLVKPGVEPLFKYSDYYHGTGRPDYVVADSVAEAIEMGGEQPPVMDPALLASFPADLWTNSPSTP